MVKSKNTKIIFLIIGIIVIYLLAQQSGGLPPIFLGALVTTCTDASPVSLVELSTTAFCQSAYCSLSQDEQNNTVLNGAVSNTNFRVESGCDKILSVGAIKIETRDNIDVYNFTAALASFGALPEPEKDIMVLCSNDKMLMGDKPAIDSYFSAFILCVTKDQCTANSDCSEEKYCDVDQCQLIEDCTGEKQIIKDHQCIAVDCTKNEHCITQLDQDCNTIMENVTGSCGTDYKCSYPAQVVCSKTTLMYNKYMGNWIKETTGYDTEPYKYYLALALIIIIVGLVYYFVKK